MSLLVYLNGEYLPYAEARVPVEDRGFLFGDGVYEVAKAYGGRLYRMQAHLERLARSAREIGLGLPDVDLGRVAGDLMERNGFKTSDCTVYIEITRGSAAPRAHQFPPPGTSRTVLVIVREMRPVPRELRSAGVAAITQPDLRWGRCDIKSVNLLPNVLAKQAATAAGAWEAILVRDGIAIEGSSSNLFVVKDNQIITYPESPQILGGITRAAVLEHAGALGYAVRQAPIPLAELWGVDEVFLTSTTMEVMPVVRVDGRNIGQGRPGPVAGALYAALLREAAVSQS